VLSRQHSYLRQVKPLTTFAYMWITPVVIGIGLAALVASVMQAGRAVLLSLQAVGDSIRQHADSVRSQESAYDGAAFAELKADVALLPITWEKILDEMADHASKAFNERQRIDKVFSRAKARLEESSAGDDTLQAELEIAGVPYEVGSAEERMQAVHEDVAGHPKPATAYKFGTG